MAETQLSNRTQLNKLKAEHILSAPTLQISYVQETAMNLYNLGFNVFPVPYMKKGGWPWRMMQYVRLNPDDIYPLFRDRCNLAVMTGRTSGNLFVIDCETKTAFVHHEQMLREAGIPIYAVQSGGNKGGGHLYLRCSEGEVKGVRPGERKDYEVRGNRCYVLAPPSMHPDGALYEWHIRESSVPPEVTLSDINWLGLSLAKNSPKESIPQPFIELSSSTRDFITSGASEGERNNRLFTAACDLAGNDYDHHTAIQLLLPPAIKSGLLKREIYDTIHSAYSKPRSPSKPTAQKKQLPKPHEKALAWIEQQTWKGRQGQTDKAVMIACCQRAVTANEKGVFRASSREVAELARVTRTTASIALKRLIEAKNLVFAGKCKLTGANLYRFSTKTQKIPSKVLRNRDTATIPGGVVSVLVARKSDAAEQGALGKTGYDLYQVMLRLQKGAKVKELAELSRLSSHQVYRALKRLREYGLVKKKKNIYVADVLDSSLLDQRVAQPTGTLGKGEKRRRQHQRERGAAAAKRFYQARWGQEYKQEEPRRWRCPNCGQVWSIPDLEPPAVCDYCGDCVTWARI